VGRPNDQQAPLEACLTADKAGTAGLNLLPAFSGWTNEW